MAGLSTVGDLVTFALKANSVNGQGQTPTAQDSDDMLTLLITLMDEWQVERFMVPSLQEVVIPSTGAVSYSIGPSRPDRVESAFARILTGTPPLVDYPLKVIEAREDYNLIAVKSLTTIPTCVFYDTSWPTGLLYFWPVPPSGQYEMHVSFKFPMPVYATLSDPIKLPPVYLSALVWNLACRGAIIFGQEPTSSMVAAMRAANRALRMANTQIAELQMPAGVTGRHTGGIAAGSSPGFNSGLW